MTISVIVPAHQAAGTLDACLSGIFGAGFPAEAVLVVDDGSRDATVATARARGVGVLSNPAPLRPARARNRGAGAVAAEVLLFVDADVVLRPGARARLEAHFRDPEVTAVIGSYDDRPDGGSTVSDYRNLLHHWVHQRAPGPSDTFWTGIGAVRRDAFLAAGGLRSEWENIEDVEFGLRLTGRGGRILLDPEIQGTHLKVWTPASMARTDLFGRAVPWTRLLRARRARAGRLNTGRAHRVAALGVASAAAGLVLAPVWAPAAWLAAAGIAAFLGASLPFLRALRRIRGAGFALRAVPWHALHYAAALAGYALVRLGLD
jgi:glycosyltransferase involved in cell wall biosynthesis